MTQRADSDPAAVLKGVIIRPPAIHSKALPEADIREYWRRLRNFKGSRATAIACELILYLFPRTIELRQGEWTELDLDDAEWVIDESKMKMRRKHMVPLPRQAVVLFRELQTITGSGRWCFPNTRRPTAVMDRMTINRALTYMGYPPNSFTGHDFRSTASTHLHEMGYRSEVIERQLAHAPRDQVQAAYNHAQYLPERRKMMQEWADWLDSLKG